MITKWINETWHLWDVTYYSNYWVTDVLLILILFIVFCIIILIYQTIDEWNPTKVIAKGKVVDKAYSAATSSSGTGIGMAGGNPAVVSVSSSTSDDWNLIVKEDSTRIIRKVECSPEFYYDVQNGAQVEYYNLFGRLSKEYLKSSGI